MDSPRNNFLIVLVILRIGNFVIIYRTGGRNKRNDPSISWPLEKKDSNFDNFSSLYYNKYWLVVNLNLRQNKGLMKPSHALIEPV